MFYDGEMLLGHYQRWLDKYKDAIDAKLNACLDKPNPQEAMRQALDVVLTDVLPIALAEMIMFNNGRLEEAVQNITEGSCSSCATNIK